MDANALFHTDPPVAASVGSSACQSHVVSSELMAPASMFSLTRVRGSDMGTDWESTDIYVHLRADRRVGDTRRSISRLSGSTKYLTGIQTLLGKNTKP
jgi:hypothetical protein